MASKGGDSRIGFFVLILLVLMVVVWRLAAPASWHNAVWFAAIVAAVVMGVAFHFGWWG